jgi:DNA primase
MRNIAESIRHSADIVRVISEYVSLKGAGKNLKGLCPFHSEKTPSFSVHAEKQIFHCFGCGAGGDVFKFVMLAEQVTFPESLRIVAEKCGIPMPKVSLENDPLARERELLLGVYEKAAAFFARRLRADDAKGARKIIAERQIRPEFVERFGLGYAPAYGLLKTLNLSNPLGSGLFQQNDKAELYDRFRRRLMFPIWNERGKVIAFGGRIVGDGQPKYLNSPESPLYSKSFVLYGLHLAKAEARKAGRMVVVEGYFDCLSLHQGGIANVVASCGTSLTSQQVAVLARCAPEVVVNYDPDAAGQNAAKRSIQLLLDRGLTVRILTLPGGLDPDDFVRREGVEAYRRELDRAPYFWEHLISRARAEADLTRPEVKSRVVSEILGYVSRIADRVVKLEIVRAVGEQFGLPAGVLVDQIKARDLPLASVSRTTQKQKLTLAEKQIIQAILQDPEVAVSLKSFLGGEFLQGMWAGVLIERLIRSPKAGLEQSLDGLDDQDLQQAVRAAAMEPFGKISAEIATVSMGQLYQAHLVKREKEIREQLEGYRSGSAPPELVRRQMEIATEKSRLKTMQS